MRVFTVDSPIPERGQLQVRACLASYGVYANDHMFEGD